MDQPWYRKLFAPPERRAQTFHPQPDQEGAEAQFALGLKYSSSDGAGADFQQALACYRKAADQNHSLAQFNLGIMYARGQGVMPDDAESAFWFVRAAQQGDAGAQFNLGRRCQQASLKEKGESTVESRIEAYKWYRLAAEQGYSGAAHAYEDLTLAMTREDVTAGIKRFDEFQSKHPPRAQDRG